MNKNIVWSLLFVLAFIVGCDDENDPFAGNDNFITSFSLRQGEQVYPAFFRGDTILLVTPEGISLQNVKAEIVCSENSTIIPDPATVENWEQQQYFVVTSHSGIERKYLYIPSRSGQAVEGIILLNTQAEVDAFGAKGVTHINGSLIIGRQAGTDTITSLAALTALKRVSDNVILNTMFKGYEFTGLNNLEEVGGSLHINAADSIWTLPLNKLASVGGDFNVTSASIAEITCPALKSVGGSVTLAAPFVKSDFSALQQVSGALALKGKAAMQSLSFQSLERVGETVEVNMSVVRLEFPELRSCDKLTVVKGSMALLYCPKLQDIATELNIADNPLYTESTVDRTRRCVERDKNRPSVVIWSMGNEAGYGCTFEDALAWTKSYDPTRLTHYESSMHHPRNPKRGKTDFSNIDLRSRMYAAIPEMHAYLGNNPDKPFIQCEFVHAMGNGPGDIEDYYQLEEQYDTFVGGFVWEWCDHGVYMGTTDDGRKKFYYGGDSGEYPHDGNFCMDGLVYPDRTPSTGLKEYKNVHRPVRVHLVDAASGTYILQNNLDFTNLKEEVYLTYEILQNGMAVASGEIRDTELLDVAPRSKKTVQLPIKPLENGACSVIISSHQLHEKPFTPADFKLGFDQIMLNENCTDTLTALLNAEKASADSCSCAANGTASAITYTENDRVITINGADFVYVYNKLTGMFDSMIYKNHSFLKRPMEMNIWRAPTDNDRVVKRLWYEAGYDKMTQRAYNTTVEAQKDGSLKLHTTSSMAPIFRQRFLEIDAEWIITPDGIVRSSMEIERDAIMRGMYSEYFEDVTENDNPFQPNEAFLPRLGIRLFLSKRMNQAEYFGYGPHESYIDKRRASYLGKFTSRVCDLHEDYMRPQENGSHYHCEYVSVADDSRKLTVYNEQPISFNLSEYTEEELTTKGHNYELEKSGYTVFCIDYRQSGIGSGSCGPQLAKEYRLDDTHYTFSFHLKPEIL